MTGGGNTAYGWHTHGTETSHPILGRSLPSLFLNTHVSALYLSLQFSQCLQLGMRATLWICATIGATSTAQNVAGTEDIDNRLRIGFISERNDLPLPPACGVACQERFPFNLVTACTHHQVFSSDATRCVQKECPRLQDVLDWQTYYAAKCDLKARDEGLIEIGTSWALHGIATLAVIGRLLSRSRRLGGPGFWWDDWLVLGLWVLSIELGVCLVFLRKSWAGRDAIGIVNSQDVANFLMWVYISVPFYIIGTYGSKVAWVALYMRMWDFNTPFRKLCWATIFVMAVSTVMSAVGAIVVYWPFHYYLGDTAIVRHSHGGIQILPVVYSVAAINIVTDFWVLLLPVPKLMSLTGVTRRRKTGICIVFLLGFVVTAVSISRLKYIVPLHNSTNVTYDFGHFGSWSEYENHLSMISCNLPALAGLVNRLRHRRQPVHHAEESIGTPERTPPKTPSLNTWKKGSATTSEQRRSGEEYEQIAMRHVQTEAPG